MIGCGNCGCLAKNPENINIRVGLEIWTGEKVICPACDRSIIYTTGIKPIRSFQNETDLQDWCKRNNCTPRRLA